MRLPLILTALLALSACNTIRGAGQDISDAGKTISAGATEVQQDM